MLTRERTGAVVSGLAGGAPGAPASGPNGQSPRSARASTRVWSVPAGIATKASAVVSNATQSPLPEMLACPAPDSGLRTVGTRAPAHELGGQRDRVAQEHVQPAVGIARHEVGRDGLERDAGAGRIDRRTFRSGVAGDPIRSRRWR